MTAPDRVGLLHFTHIDHLESMTLNGLLCDSAVGGCLTREAGEPSIKASRRTRTVPVGPGGVVADYVPFYFAPRSPMLYRISKGGVPSYTGSQRDLVYLCTTVHRLTQQGVRLVVTDRNAALAYANFAATVEDWTTEGFIDWPLMKSAMWNNDAQHPDRKERRMAECLAHDTVPWAAIATIATYDQRQADAVTAALLDVDHRPRVTVRRDWYF